MNYAAIVLAAGSGSRFGSDKLSAPFLGEPLVYHAIGTALHAPVKRIIVIAHPSLRLDRLENSTEKNVAVLRISSQAMSETLRAGLQAAGEVDGLFVFLGDMPLIPRGIAGKLAEKIGSSFAAMPWQAGKPGHPVLLSRQAFGEIGRLEGDEGLGKILRSRDDVAFVETQSPFIHADIDHLETLADLEKAHRSANGLDPEA